MKGQLRSNDAQTTICHITKFWLTKISNKVYKPQPAGKRLLWHRVPPVPWAGAVNEDVQIATSETLLVETNRIQSEYRVLRTRVGRQIEAEMHLPAREKWRG